MATVSWTPSNFEARYQSGFGRSVIKIAPPQGASSGTVFSPSTGYKSSMTSDVVFLSGYDSIEAFYNVNLSGSTSHDIKLQVSDASGGTFRDITRRSITGGIATDVSDYDRFSTGGDYQAIFKSVIGPFVRWRIKRNGGTVASAGTDTVKFILFSTESKA